MVKFELETTYSRAVLTTLLKDFSHVSDQEPAPSSQLSGSSDKQAPRRQIATAHALTHVCLGLASDHLTDEHMELPRTCLTLRESG